MADKICKLTIELMPRNLVARLLINAVEQYQTKNPLNMSMRNSEQLCKERSLEKYKEMSLYFKDLEKELQMTLVQKEIELDMRED